MRSNENEHEYNAIHFLNAWASTGSEKMLRAFLSSLYFIGQSGQSKEFQANASVNEFGNLLIKERALLISNKEAIAGLIINLSAIINSILELSDPKTGKPKENYIRNYIKSQVLATYSRASYKAISSFEEETSVPELNSFVEEATVSAAMRIESFLEIFLEQLNLTIESIKEDIQKESGMEKIPISDSPRPMAKSSNGVGLDLEVILTDIIYEKVAPYILHCFAHDETEKKVPSLALPLSNISVSPRLSSARLSPVGLHKMELLYSGVHSASATPREKEELSWQIAEFVELFAMIVLFPFSCMLAEKYSLVAAVRDKKARKIAIAAPIPVGPVPPLLFDLFKGGQELPRPPELVSSRGEGGSPSPC